MFNQVLKKKEEEERRAGVRPVKKIGMFLMLLFHQHLYVPLEVLQLTVYCVKTPIIIGPVPQHLSDQFCGYLHSCTA
jgi:hypothetical protein